MKKFISLWLSALLLVSQALASNPTGSANQVLRIPSGGGLGKYGSLDLTQSSTVGTSILGQSNGGTGGVTFDASYEIRNVGVAGSVGSNALTISLKQKDGSTNCGSVASGTACFIGFRSSTATSGAYLQRSVISSLSVVVSSGSTLGQIASQLEPVFVYAIDNAGTVELAVSTTLFFDEGSLFSTTAEGGAGAADNRDVIYSTTARTNVPIRLIGRIQSSQATPGTWATTPAVVSPSPVGNAAPWFVDGLIYGATHYGLITGNVSQATPIDMTTTTVSMNPAPGSAPVGIACAAPATAPQTVGTLTCNALSQNESNGITFNIPVIGWYNVCTENQYDSAVGANAVDISFYVVETATNALTSLRTIGFHGTENRNGDITPAAITVCGPAFFASTGTKVLRLFYAVEGTSVNTSTILAGTSGPVQLSIHWSVRQIK